MKKGLSILLIAAALFGFYGGAVSLNDVLACKEYWEEQGEKSTADMNKLEDGLNQLKDNEQAYLDGVQQVADGEEALADAEQQLADGEVALAEGRATLAKGEADYAAAPGKLADARKKLAAGEEAVADGEQALADGKEALEEGQESIDGLTKLIKGIKTIRTGYNSSWRPGYEKLKDGRDQIYSGSKGSKDDLTALAAFLDSSDQKAYLAAVEDVAGDDEKQAASDYTEFIESTNELATDIPKIQKKVKTLDKQANALLAALKAASTNFEFAGVVSAQKSALLAMAELISDSSQKSQFTAGVNSVADAYDNFDNLVEANMDNGWAAFFASDDGKAAISKAKQGIALALWQKSYGKTGQPSTEEEQEQYATILNNITDDQAKAYIKENSAEAQAGVKAGVEAQVKAGYESNDTLTAGKAALIKAMATIAGTLDAVNESVNGDDSALKNKLLPGLKTFNAAATTDAVDALSEGQDTIASGIATVASAVLGNKTLKAGVKKNFGSSAIKLLKKYKSASGPLSTSKSDFAAFEKQMDSDPGLKAFLKKAQALLSKTKASGLKTLAAGKKKLAAGKKELAAGKKTLAAGYKAYAKGLADYKAAPAKLAAGRKQLAEGEATLADGYAAYEEGKATLAAGKEQLATYEDGEQQVRDGLATLVGTEPNGGLTSILDRLNGDDDFDNGDNHLDLDEGLAAVDTGRGYQSDSGELITAELTNRAISTGALLGAGVLAVLAAILSFLKKNKGAGVCAILAAVAGIAGAIIANNAGTEFSSIAGSTVGATGMAAAGILGVVALVHAIAHFTAKKEA